MWYTLALFELSSSDDSRSAAVWIELYVNSITYKNLDAVQTHFAGKIRECNLAVCKLYTKKCIWESLLDDSIYNLWFSHICVQR